ncbi:RES family NAD+ phosphorylase [Steroidobacter flavus]|uniref:RES family NAD+ phosphorylase n=1 Tax=Steroidobacter flavus TaxID=1842136 RepID=A0ABV8SYE2_9GAMM
MSINHVPPPPHPFPQHINSTTLPVGTELHRIYGAKFPGNGFNPRVDKLNRFSPIFSRGEPVPVLYAGSTAETAIYETLFHDAHVKGAKHQSLPLSALTHRRYGSWKTQRSLKLATLHAPDLAGFGVTTDQLTATNSIYYVQTARWAEAIHDNHADIEGLQWTSYRADPGVAYVLFGDRVGSEDLFCTGNEVLIRRDVALYRLVLECAARSGVRIARPRMP